MVVAVDYTSKFCLSIYIALETGSKDVRECALSTVGESDELSVICCAILCPMGNSECNVSLYFV